MDELKTDEIGKLKDDKAPADTMSYKGKAVSEMSRDELEVAFRELAMSYHGLMQKRALFREVILDYILK